MAEIKSTLDLVMERTRHLKLSDAEKEAQTAVQTKRRVAGLVQRYLDQTIKPQEFVSEMEPLERELPASRALVAAELIDRIDFSGKDEPILILLQDHLNTPADPLRRIVSDCRQTLKEQAAQRITEIRHQLKTARKISGSAVLPNLEADERWRRQRQHTRAQFRERLEVLKPV